ncbi:MAG: DDE-type integrase/transposase/recombinase [Chloroflexi bacterium]|nr:DDE-type integrase/transposase/recombinase [Chloroflexota bacterium]
MSKQKPLEPDSADLPTEVALFRYGLIAQLIHTPPDKGHQEALLRDIAARTYRIPGSKRTRVSLSTLRRYLKTYQAKGFEALRPASRADVGIPRAFPSEILEKAIALREEQPARTTQTVVDILQRDPTVLLPHPPNVHTLTTHLRQRGKTRRLLGVTAKVYRRFERDHVNSLWQGDALVGPWLPDPQVPGRQRRAHLFCFIDDHSRLVPYAEFFFDEALPRMERVLKVALLRRGVPHAVYVDNGQVYSSVQFGAACATLGIERIQTAPYSPEAKGKQERFFETLRLQFLPEVETANITTLTELNVSLWAWLECVYHRHEHSETHQAPLARYTAGLAQVRHADPETVRRAFLWREKRKVRRDAILSLQGNRYQVASAYAGRILELRFDPFDLTQVELYLDRALVGVATVVIQTRQRHLAVEHLATEPPDPPKPKSSLDYLAALRAEYHAQQQRELGPLQFARLAPAAETPASQPTSTED